MNICFKRHKFVRVLKIMGIKPNEHILSRKDVPIQVVYSFAKSERVNLNDLVRSYRNY